VELRQAIEDQKSRLLDLSKQRDEISVLKRDVESAQRAFEGVSQRSSTTRLESLSAQTNAVVLTPAAPPSEHSKPKVLLNVLVSIFLGTLLGVGAALMLELGDRKVRSAQDLAEAIELPLLASVASTEPPQSKREFLLSLLPRRKAPTAAALRSS
jgi:uncharacterized protein involved in exopolysaccharide biosynthesis